VLSYYNEVMNCCLQAEQSCIPTTGHHKRKRVPGWNDLVSGKRQQVLHFHHLWKDAGRPQQGDMYENMKRARKDYHYAVRS
jgi:hypothetical protein